jgi:hypothetical protein
MRRALVQQSKDASTHALRMRAHGPVGREIELAALGGVGRAYERMITVSVRTHAPTRARAGGEGDHVAGLCADPGSTEARTSSPRARTRLRAREGRWGEE